MSPAADQKARVERCFSWAFEPSGADGLCAGPAAAMAALRAQVRRIEQGTRLGKARPVAPLGLAALADALPDRKSVVEGKSVSARLGLGGRRIIKHKTTASSNNKYSLTTSNYNND